MALPPGTCHVILHMRATLIENGDFMKPDTRLADWAIKTVETNYADDVCLLLEHNSLRLERDMAERSFSFYIPATNRANGLNRTFIIDGIGYDLFPMSWERIENMADVKDYNTTCLANAEILWARSEADKQRFTSLQARLAANLQNPAYMRERAAKWLEHAKDIFTDTLFEARVYKVRENAGHICDLLSIAVAFANTCFFKHGQTNQLHELEKMQNVPPGFIQLYRDIVAEPCPDAQKKLCHRMILLVKEFLETKTQPTGADFAELAVWYQEMCYWWRRIYHWCDANDSANAYVWGCGLQGELDEWGAKNGITDTDIMSHFSASDLAAFRKRAEAVEQKFRQVIAKNGVKLDEYGSIEEFLQANEV